jgi:hypothetical protein
MRAARAAPLAALWALAWVAGAAGAGAGAATVLAQQADLARAGSAALDYLPPPLADRRARAPPRSPAGLPAPASGGAPAPPSLTRCAAPHPRPTARLWPVTRLLPAVARPRSQGAGPYAPPARRMRAVAAAAVGLCVRAAAPCAGAAAPHMAASAPRRVLRAALMRGAIPGKTARAAPPGWRLAAATLLRALRCSNSSSTCLALGLPRLLCMPGTCI